MQCRLIKKSAELDWKSFDGQIFAGLTHNGWSLVCEPSDSGHKPSLEVDSCSRVMILCTPDLDLDEVDEFGPEVAITICLISWGVHPWVGSSAHGQKMASVVDDLSRIFFGRPLVQRMVVYAC